jgi:hypothetical protein
MVGMTMDMVKTGDYIKLKGHKVQDRFQRAWWKVTGVRDGVVHMVDRNGQAGRMSTSRRYQECRALKWEPGDDRNDSY